MKYDRLPPVDDEGFLEIARQRFREAARFRDNASEVGEYRRGSPRVGHNYCPQCGRPMR